ncbi:MAG: hypothetical protein LBR60_05015 [Fibrobacter sp.]|nr:hypothetical protein [Fibrobacter sp.]
MNCPTVCYPREKLAKKCNGKEYNPTREECYNENFVACKGQVTDCGGCVRHTDCDGNPVTYEDGTPIDLCWERVREDCPYSSSSAVGSSSSVNNTDCSEKEYDPQTHFCDARDGKVYKFVEIGNQTWMAENLNYNDYSSVCYNPCPLCDWVYDCDTYQDAYRLYDTQAVQPRPCPDVEGAYCGVCPQGWHIPTDEEWTVLTDFVGNDAAKLKAENWQGTDNYGFAARPGVYDNYSKIHFQNPIPSSQLRNLHDIGRWWSSTEPFWECPVDENDPLVVCSRPAPSAYIRQMSGSDNAVLRDVSTISNAIRCVKDVNNCKKPKIPRCGGCVTETDCLGNPVLYNGKPSTICYARPLNCV